MKPNEPSHSPARLPFGVFPALGAALLFGATTPASKTLLTEVGPQMLAALLYLGSGIGLVCWMLFSSKQLKPLLSVPKADIPWLAGTTFFGGMLGPVFLLLGLSFTPASTASLLLNLEGVLTAIVAWMVFKEHCDRRIVLGMVCITIGGIVLAWQGNFTLTNLLGPCAIAAACLCWGIDNNLTRKISGSDARMIVVVKSLMAGSANLLLAFLRGESFPSFSYGLLAMGTGFVGYGLSLLMFIVALRHLGTSRTGAYFSSGPFFGSALSVLILHEHIDAKFLPAALLMGAGLWLHLTERHEHQHMHALEEHEHVHEHDEHHQHEHKPDDPPGKRHTHKHAHTAVVHSHTHFPDLHHRHPH